MDTRVNGMDQQIHIMRLNKEKTCKMNRTHTAYHVFFELSSTPAQVWKNIFQQQWKEVSATFPEKETTPAPSIGHGFLVAHCLLDDVAPKYFPALKSTVAAANTYYEEYLIHQADVKIQKEQMRKNERSIVDEMEKMLHFD
jgi:hypothetical protein